MNFSQLNGLDITSRRYTFEELEGAPWIEVEPAAECNKAFTQATLARQGKLARQMQRGKPLSLQMKKAQRNIDRGLYAEFICKGWGGWTDNDGNEIPFSEDAAKELMAALPDDIFDGLRIFCTDTSNFRGEGDDLDEEDIAELAGN